MDYRIYAVHGTFAADHGQRGERWWQRESPFSKAVLSYLDTATCRVVWEPMQWTGANKASARGAAAEKLAGVLSRVDFRHNTVAVLAHSHGGNVAYSAISKLEGKSSVPDVPVVTVGTPFIPEAHVDSWMFDTLPRLWLGSALALCVSLAAFSVVDEGPVVSVVVLVMLVALLALLVLGLYVRLILGLVPRLLANPALGPRAMLGFRQIDEKRRRANARHPKLYSQNDEAINGLRGAPTQKIALATPDTATIPTAIVSGLVLLALSGLLFPLGSSLPGNGVARHFAAFGGSTQELWWVDVVARYAAWLGLSAAAGLLASRLLLSRWAAKIFNSLFTATIKERAFGRDTGFGRALPMIASPNLPLLFHRYADGEEWKPVPKQVDDELDAITTDCAIGMVRAVRETLGMGLMTGNYSFSESLSTNFRGDELVHCAYFQHPDFPGFVAWILCEFYGFPKGPNYATLPHDKYRSWWAAIRPDPWPPTSTPATVSS